MTNEAHKIDVHHHIVPKEYLAALASVGINNAVGEPFPNWDIDSSIAFMDRQGIDVAITSISAPGIYFGDIDFTRKLARECNEISARLVEKYPNRIGAFAVLPMPDIEFSLEELEYSLDILNLDGVTLLTNIEYLYLGDPQYNEIFSELNRRKSVVFVHPNSSASDKLPMVSFKPAILEFVFNTTRAIANLIHTGTIKQYSNIRFIFAHAGGSAPYIAWRISFGKKRILNYLRQFYYEVALSAAEFTLNSLTNLVKSSQILFGSDYPFVPDRVVEEMSNNIEIYQEFDEKSRKAIYKENAKELFPRIRSE
jgi:predicted TIM-barrel fold metal-dependent hydrolase